ncbi:MAG: acyl-CoA thioesterase [Leptospiraceae bacterium]|nr:acyl-CoA thioesterase [Leptospiraceae bacterium]MCP5499913.1 acyl-CoA thioesterase [Leptospiraceae bacterium]
MIITPIQIRFNDLDPMRRVNNASYAAYLELARMDFCNRYFPIDSLEDTPFVLVRVEMDIQNSLGPNEKAEVRTIVSRIGHSSWEFYAEIVNPESNKIYARAKTTQVYFDYRENTKKVIPESFRKILETEMQ